MLRIEFTYKGLSTKNAIALSTGGHEENMRSIAHKEIASANKKGHPFADFEKVKIIGTDSNGLVILEDEYKPSEFHTLCF